jgi:hypothetical protein
MEKKRCCRCNKIFSRQWNLERHLQDVHEINNDIRKGKRRGGIDGYDYEYGQLSMNSANNLKKTEITIMIWIIKEILIIIIIFLIFIPILDIIIANLTSLQIIIPCSKKKP